MLKWALLRTLERTPLLKPTFRFYEAATTLRTRGSREQRADELPLPPAYLRTLAAGTADPHWFLESGRRTAEIVQFTTGRHGLPLDSVAQMLDFGCGCGRVLRHWKDLTGPKIHGAEPNPQLADWCARSLPFAQISRSLPLPPLPYKSGSFDFIYAISVFTHLTEGAQLVWVEELRRLLSRSGLLVVSTHGDRYVGRLSPAERHSYDAGCLVVRRPRASGTNLCSVFHPRAYLEGRFAAGFDVVELTTGGLEQGTPHQDLVVLRKSAQSETETTATWPVR
jgi:SAM-dependent methyltransferase